MDVEELFDLARKLGQGFANDEIEDKSSDLQKYVACLDGACEESLKKIIPDFRRLSRSLEKSLLTKLGRKLCM